MKPVLEPFGLYDPVAERDACGTGFVASLEGQPCRRVVDLALGALCRLAHRGARSADGTGDGAGILVDLPLEFLQEETGLALEPGRVGAGVLFLPREAAPAAIARRLVEEALEAESIPLLGWREVPTRPEVLGRYARETCPAIVQLLVGAPPGVQDLLELEQTLYRARRRAEAAARREEALQGHLVYWASFSCRTLVYKGLLMAGQLPAFYPDLAHPAFRSRFALFHQRYSTNTTPSWRRAQPFRVLAHNGEINTLQGNTHWMAAREPLLAAPAWEGLGELLRPVLDPAGSDSAMLDNLVELLALSGRSLPHALAMVVPEAWEGILDMPPALAAFYRYHSALLEPWDGPAGLVFADGRHVGAALDRNGLRPLRYVITTDGLVAASSEAGSLPIEPPRTRRLGKLGPGQMLVVDLEQGRVLENAEVKEELASQQPYARWCESGFTRLPDRREDNTLADGEVPGPETLRQLQTAFAYTSEELSFVLEVMVETAKEPVGSMGDDTPLAVLSAKPRPVYHYLKERFAEVTNPPIDHLRERIVFSLRTLLGPRGNLLAQSPDVARLLELPSPLLTEAEIARIEDLGRTEPRFRSVRLPMLFPASRGPAGLRPALLELCRRAEEAVAGGAGILILSDRQVSPEQAPVPALLAVGAVHHHLIRTGQRMRVSLVVESGEPREVHHVACLLGYGANAVVPYLALQTARRLAVDGRVKVAGREISPREAVLRLQHAFEEGLLKVMSKMGISTVDAYTGAQIFEAVGLSRDVIDLCLRGTPSRVEGNGFEELGQVVLYWHGQAFSRESPPGLHNFGYYRYKKDGEFHGFNPPAVRALHRAVRLGETVYDLEGYEAYKEFARLARLYRGNLRDLLELVPAGPPVPLEEVEPVSEILPRFSTGHMSLGALSPEAHQTLAIAMNRLGARAGSGEGGEEAERFWSERTSRIKQVASGRFGVTPEYLAAAAEIQIKMAQGSKPGEGGQIPGHKVTEYIARLRHTTPGVALISPPPHHDIYSIEDLAQLIYDLKQANPRAEISVKLVCQTGVGVIAAGVVKGGADIVLLSGDSGGTGSSPLNSIKNAGLPWEIGLAETQQTLRAQGLRERVGLRVDGGIKTGRDVVIAAALGADEFSFGTMAMIAEGCLMARICQTNNCPAGVATQRVDLRAKFPGVPENVMNYFLYVAQEVREILASLGLRRLDQLVGRVELLRPAPEHHPAAARLDLSPLIALPPGPSGEELPRQRLWRRNPLPVEARLDDRIVLHFQAVIEGRETKAEPLSLPIHNTDRAVGATLGYEIARRHGNRGLPEGRITVEFRGTAGQSFGAFLLPGVHFTLRGQANDYVGKGMAGGEILILPDPDLPPAARGGMLLGNACLYGATGGSLFAAGRAGERFAIRNSGAVAVVEGVGDHGCEYMTGGTVVVLGPVGYNFAAGMTGGEAFVYDAGGLLPFRLNADLVCSAPLTPEEARFLQQLLHEHYRKTASSTAWQILADWSRAAPCFYRIAPRSEVRAVAAAHEGATPQGA